MEKTDLTILKEIDEQLSGVEESRCRRILSFAWDKFCPGSQFPAQKPETEHKQHRPSAVRPIEPERSGRREKRRTGATPSIVRDLNLHPSNKESFKDFAKAKAPKTDQQKMTLAVYYVKNILGLTGTTADHVYTCFKNAGWRVPAGLENALAVTAHRKGWIDTRNLADITLTTPGENLVEHDLPPKTGNEP